MGLLSTGSPRQWAWSAAALALVAACGEAFTSFPDGSTSAPAASGTSSAAGGAGGAGSVTSGMGGMQSVTATAASVSATQSSAMSSTGSIQPAGSSSTGVVMPTCPGEMQYCVNEWITEDKGLAGIGNPTADDKYLYFGANAAIYRATFANASNPLPEAVAGMSGSAGYQDGIGAKAMFGKLITASVYNPDTKTIYVADSGNCVIRALVLSTLAVTTLSGKQGECTHVDGSGSANGGTARFVKLAGMALDSTHSFVFVVDENYVRLVSLKDGSVTTVAGQATPGSANNAVGVAASFSNPTNLVATATTVYVTDTTNGLLRQMSATPPYGVSTACGTVPGTNDGACSGSALLKGPIGVVTVSGGLGLSDASSNDLSWNTIRAISNGNLTTVAGSQTNIHKVAVGNSAGIPKPGGLFYRTTAGGHELYIVEQGTRVRRMVVP
jgi:hypothetical protein